MTCIAMQPLITSCCYEGMRMLHGAAGLRAAAATQRRGSRYPRRSRLPALQGGGRGPARSRATGNCRRLAAEARFKAFLWLLSVFLHEGVPFTPHLPDSMQVNSNCNLQIQTHFIAS